MKHNIEKAVIFKFDDPMMMANSYWQFELYSSELLLIRKIIRGSNDGYTLYEIKNNKIIWQTPDPTIKFYLSPDAKNYIERMIFMKAFW